MVTEWQLVADGRLLDESMALPTTSGLGYCVQFHYPAECRSRGYILRTADRDSTSPQKNHVKRRRHFFTPNSTKHVRLASRERNDVEEEEEEKEKEEEEEEKILF